MPQPCDQFAIGDAAIYPPHGLGRVVGLGNQEISGEMVEVIVLRFEPAAMTVRVPTGKARRGGLRAVASKREMAEALQALSSSDEVPCAAGAADWKRRVKQCAEQVNSGDPVQIARVVRELSRGVDGDPLPSAALAVYTNAINRLSQELAIIEEISEADAAAQITGIAQCASS